MKLFLCLAILLISSSGAFAQMRPIEERAADQAIIYQQDLGLDAIQTAAIEEALVKKLEVGKEAWQTKQNGDEEGGKEMNKLAAKEFMETLKSTLTKEQMEKFKTIKESIQEKVKEIK